MTIRPGISTLSKFVDSRYTLVIVAAKRARMIGADEEAPTFAECDTENPVSIAANEIAEGRVGYVRHSTVDMVADKAYEGPIKYIVDNNSSDDPYTDTTLSTDPEANWDNTEETEDTPAENGAETDDTETE